MPDDRGAVAYRWLWAGLVVPLGALGATMAVVGPNGHTTGAMALVVAVCAVALHSVRGRGPGVPPRRLWEVAATCAFATVAIVGLASLVGPACGWLAVLVALTCPAVMTTVRRRLNPPSVVPPRPADAAAPPRPTLFLPTRGSPSQLTTAELCAAWVQSSAVLARLQESGTVFAQSRVIMARQLFLDELEYRNPTGFAQWMQRGAEAADNPSRYLCTSPPGPRSSRR